MTGLSMHPWKVPQGRAVEKMGGVDAGCQWRISEIPVPGLTSASDLPVSLTWEASFMSNRGTVNLWKKLKSSSVSCTGILAPDYFTAAKPAWYISWIITPQCLYRLILSVYICMLFTGVTIFMTNIYIYIYKKLSIKLLQSCQLF